MGILQIYSENDFYKKVDPNSFVQGQLCRIVVPHLSIIPQILDVERTHPEEHEKIHFKLRNANPDKDFRASDRTLPIKYLNLRANEELLVQRAKKRPGVIVSSRLDLYPEISKLLRQKGKKHLQEDSLFVIPCYGIESRDNPHGFPPEMVARIRCLLYRQFFFLPPRNPLRETSIARFDRVQVVIGRNRETIEPTELCLSDALLSLFISLFLFCLSGFEDGDLRAIRDLTKEAYIEPT
jgi:hypothetical protein